MSCASLVVRSVLSLRLKSLCQIYKSLHRFGYCMSECMFECLNVCLSVTVFPPKISHQILNQSSWNFQARPTFTQLTIWKPYQPYPTLPYITFSPSIILNNKKKLPFHLNNYIYKPYLTLLHYPTLPYAYP